MKYTFSKDTKTFKVFKALKDGATITPAQAKKQFGIGNMSAEASRIRQNGYAVYSNTRKASNGVVVREYTMGNPSREVVALGNAAKAKGLTLETI